MIDVLKGLIKQFMPFAQQQMGFDRPPKLFLRQDKKNAANPMGKTGFYDPENESVTIYITDRHPKDIMRSLAHELMHHTQKCNGDFDKVTTMGEEGYAQNDPHMRTMEIQAYQASIVFRDWEDSCKGTIYYEHLQKGDKSSMSTKNWKNQELKSLLTEKWGFKMDLSKLKLNEDKDMLISKIQALVDEERFSQRQGSEAIQIINKCGYPGPGSVKCISGKSMIALNVMRMLGLLGKVDPISGNVHEETLKEAHCAGKRDDEPCGKEDCPKCGKNREDKSLEEEAKGKYDDGDGKKEKCDYVDCEGEEKDQIEEYAMAPKDEKEDKD